MKVIQYIILITILGLLYSCNGSDSIDKEKNVARPNPPLEYQALNNPYSKDTDILSRGEEIFKSNCASCHGNTGKGDGVVAKSLDPAPTNISVILSDVSDGYLYWRISDGGGFEPFSSSMPGWKTILSEEEIWQVISYIRSLN